jgi:hypothetical protein
MAGNTAPEPLFCLKWRWEQSDSMPLDSEKINTAKVTGGSGDIAILVGTTRVARAVIWRQTRRATLKS